MQLEKIKLSELVPDSRNARKHDKRNVDEVARSLKQLGQHRAFVVQRGTNKILVGNGMFEAMKQLGWTEGSVYFVDDNDETAIKRALADNRTAELAEWDMDVLSELLGEMEIPDIPGWTEEEISDLLGEQISPDELGTSFELPDDERGEMRSMTFTLHVKQAEVLNEALESVMEGTQINLCDMFGNTNKKGNALYLVVKQWAESKI